MVTEVDANEGGSNQSSFHSEWQYLQAWMRMVSRIFRREANGFWRWAWTAALRLLAAVWVRLDSDLSGQTQWRK
jgi:hypothetical protein